MSWIADGLQKLTEICTQSVSASSRSIVRNRRDDMLLISVRADGLLVVDKIENEAPLRRHEVENPDDIIRYLKDSDEASVWVSEDGIIVLLNDRAKFFDRDQLWMNSRVHPLVTWLREHPTLNQAELITAIRTQLWEALSNAAALIKTISRLQFFSNESGAVERTQSKATLDRSIDQGISSGDGEVPEFLRLRFRPIDIEYMSEQTIEVALITDPGRPVFKLIPHGRQLDHALDANLTELRAYLSDQIASPVFAGRPRCGTFVEFDSAAD